MVDLKNSFANTPDGSSSAGRRGRTRGISLLLWMCDARSAVSTVATGSMPVSFLAFEKLRGECSVGSFAFGRGSLAFGVGTTFLSCEVSCSSMILGCFRYLWIVFFPDSFRFSESSDGWNWFTGGV